MSGNDYLTIGGIKFRKNDVKKQELSNDINNNKRFVVTLKTGATVEGMQRSDVINSKYSATVFVADDGTVKFNNVNSLLIEGADDKGDKFYFSGEYTKYNTINLKNDNNPDTIFLDEGAAKFKFQNSLYLGDEDCIKDKESQQ